MAAAPKTSEPNLGGSGTGHAQACAVDHAMWGQQIAELQRQLAALLAAAGIGMIGGSWYFGHGLPSDSLGNDGDLYLNTDTADIYGKENGTWL